MKIQDWEKHVQLATMHPRQGMGDMYLLYTHIHIHAYTVFLNGKLSQSLNICVPWGENGKGIRKSVIGQDIFGQEAGQLSLTHSASPLKGTHTYSTLCSFWGMHICHLHQSSLWPHEQAEWVHPQSLMTITKHTQIKEVCLVLPPVLASKSHS